MLLSFKLSVLGALFPLTIQAQTNCPLLGLDFPIPKNLSASPEFQAALANFTSIINQAQAGNTTYAKYDVSNTSTSLEIFSRYNSAPLLIHHYAIPSLATSSYGVKVLDSNTQFRLGSITKLMSVYTFLVRDGFTHFNSAITNFIPELAASTEVHSSIEDAINLVSWEDITLGDLASQLADIGRDYAGLAQLGGFAFQPDPSALGLPPLTASEQPVCLGGGFCTRAQFFAGFTLRHPVYTPSTNPIYSNAAFQILAYAAENITGMAFQTLVEETLFKPLNLTGSSWTMPTSNASGILPDGSAWSLDLGDENAAGGMYSTLTDLSSIGRSILSSSLLSPSQTRHWMKPHSLTSDPLSSVGAPWEITRLLTSPDSRPVDMYTKAGDLPGYASFLVLIPDWSIGFSVLAAGSNPDAMIILLSDAVADIILPAVEAAAREQAEASYAGVYGTCEGSNITLSLDTTKPGLGIETWFSNGTDMLTANADGVQITGPGARLYPTGLSRQLEGGDVEVGFRAVYESLSGVVGKGAFSGRCASWEGVDQWYWGTVGSDEFIVRVGGDGRAMSVEPRVLTVVLRRVRF